jgi:hypothetical protein
MADYLIHDSTLEDIADAIRAKTGGSSLIAPEDMASVIASISTGGIVLPSFLSKVDGGSFTYATDTAIQGNKVSHNLGVKPKGYIIWSDDVMMDGNAYANQTLMFSYGIGLPWVNNGSTNTTGYSYAMWRRTNGGVTEANNSTPTITSSEIAPAGHFYWRGGASYNWFAFA